MQTRSSGNKVFSRESAADVSGLRHRASRDMSRSRHVVSFGGRGRLKRLKHNKNLKEIKKNKKKRHASRSGAEVSTFLTDFILRISSETRRSGSREETRRSRSASHVQRQLRAFHPKEPEPEPSLHGLVSTRHPAGGGPARPRRPPPALKSQEASAAIVTRGFWARHPETSCRLSAFGPVSRCCGGWTLGVY